MEVGAIFLFALMFNFKVSKTVKLTAGGCTAIDHYLSHFLWRRTVCKMSYWLIALPLSWSGVNTLCVCFSANIQTDNSTAFGKTKVKLKFQMLSVITLQLLKLLLRSLNEALNIRHQIVWHHQTKKSSIWVKRFITLNGGPSVSVTVKVVLEE